MPLPAKTYGLWSRVAPGDCSISSPRSSGTLDVGVLSFWGRDLHQARARTTVDLTALISPRSFLQGRPRHSVSVSDPPCTCHQTSASIVLQALSVLFSVLLFPSGAC